MMAKMEAEITVTLEAIIIEDAILGERKRCAEVARLMLEESEEYACDMAAYVAKAIEAGA